MKNLTRVLALVLVFSMMVSSVAFAAKFTDVEEGSTYAEATDVLSALGIVNGDPEGTFRPEDDITRAEVVAIVNRLQGLSDAAKAAGGVTSYTDVAADAWYAGDVNLATQMGIVSGDGDGTFRPNDNVKYEEAVKMMVAALGYDAKYAEKQGGWPTGYLVLASNAGVTSGVGVGAGQLATRGVVAKLAYNALTAPMMAFKQYSDSGEAIYAPQKAKTLLGEKLGYVKIDGVVAATSITDVAGVGTPDDGFVKVTYALDEATDGTNGKYYKYVTGKTELLDLNGTETLAVGTTDVATALGYTAAVYVGENEDGDNEVLAYVLNAKKNDVVALNPEHIQAADTGVLYESKFGVQDAYISVYDEDNDSSNKEYNLEFGASIIVNNKFFGKVNKVVSGAYSSDTYNANMFSIAGAATDLGLVYAPNNGTVELVDKDNNGKYDYIFVKSYETVIVDEVYGQNKKISTKLSGTIDLTNAVDGKEGYSYSLKKDGADIAISELKEYDVLSIAVTSDKKNWEILVSDKKVTGTVTSAYKPNAPYTVDDYIWVINDEEYTVANFVGRNSTYDSAVKNTDAGDEGTALIDAFGNIAYFEKTSAVAGDFGFIMAAGPYTSMGKTSYEVQILNKDGSVVNYDLADKIDVTVGQTETPDVLKDTAWTTYFAPRALYVGSTMHWAFTTGTTNAPVTYADINGTTVYTTGDPTIAALTDNYANRIVTYKVNSNGKITAITFNATSTTGDPDDGLFKYDTLSSTATTSEYSATNKAFANNIGVDDSTVVFNLPIGASTTEDDFSISSVSAFTDEKNYDVSFLQVDPETSDAGVVILTNAAAQVGEADCLAVITKVMTAKNAEGYNVVQFTFLQDGEEKTYATTNDLYTSSLANTVKGSLMEYSLNADGEIDEIGFAGGTSIFGLPVASPYTATFGVAAPSYTVAAGYVEGFVVSKDASKRLQIQDIANVANTTAAYRHSVDGANVYVVDLTKTNITPVEAAYGDIQATYVDPNGKISDADRDTYVVIKYVKGVAKDVVVYKGFAKANNILQ